MPRGDGTGPMGVGPMTGRGFGMCRGNADPGEAWRSRGQGYGGGMSRGYRCMGMVGAGRGRRNRFFATGQPGWMAFSDPGPGVTRSGDEPVRTQELLRSQAAALQMQLDDIQKRLQDMGSGVETETA